MIRKILVPVRGDGKGDNVLAHAAALAHRNNSHVEVTHCRARPEDLLPFGVPIPAVFRKQQMKQAEELADVQEAGMREELKALVEKLDLATDVDPHSDRA
ncbi:universal stress protein, partial [Sedimentitalea sp. XS_ASV28]|uniref:universal stress protein n=1 Tax=Sedimentitalea sp. XS_ASV28 TaxID=3241296 RepID=UPI003513E35E